MSAQCTGLAPGLTLLKDVEVAGAGSTPRGYVALGGAVYFIADDGVHGTELWRSDGTSAGTTLVKDLRLGPLGSEPGQLFVLGTELLFSANDGLGGNELWKSDGTGPGTVRVKEIFPGNEASMPYELVQLGSYVYFAASDASGRKLWRTDGTEGGTTEVANVTPNHLAVMGSRLYFAGWDGVDQELWASDGTGPGTALLKDIRASGASGVSYLAVMNDALYFWADDGVVGKELWTSDGTDPGTVLVKDIDTGGGGAGSGANPIVAAGNLIYFVTASRALWRSDGTEPGTLKLTDLAQGLYEGQWARDGTSLYFSGWDAEHGFEPWRSDGTPGGTAMITDIRPGTLATSYPSNFVTLNGTVFFGATEDTHGTELWKTDGSAGGTVMVADFVPGPLGADVYAARVIGTEIFLACDSGVSGLELCRSDGNSLEVIADVNLNTASSGPIHATVVDGGLFFFASTRTTGAEVWRSDGTAAGTRLVADLNPGLHSGAPAYFSPPPAVLDGRLFFPGNDGTHGGELWRSDGTAAGTTMVKDVNPGAAGHLEDDDAYFAAASIVAGAAVYFRADDGTHGKELWRSDGTEAGTVLVADLNPIGDAVETQFAPRMAAIGDQVYFVARDGSHSEAIYRTAGSTPSVVSPYDLHPYELTPVGAVLYFAAEPANAELWRSDGTLAGTTRVKDLGESGELWALTAVGDRLFFTFADAAHGTELWLSDGSETGTVLVADIQAGPGGSVASRPEEPFAVIGTTVFFSADDGVAGLELWKSDGTEAGTVLVKDVFPGPMGGTPGSATVGGVAVVGTQLFFVAHDGVSGQELWMSDGTTAGTTLVADLAPPGGSSSPGWLVPFCGGLAFTANDSTHGLELFTYRR